MEKKLFNAPKDSVPEILRMITEFTTKKDGNTAKSIWISLIKKVRKTDDLDLFIPTLQAADYYFLSQEKYKEEIQVAQELVRIIQQCINQT